MDKQEVLNQIEELQKQRTSLKKQLQYVKSWN